MALAAAAAAAVAWPAESWSRCSRRAWVLCMQLTMKSTRLCATTQVGSSGQGRGTRAGWLRAGLCQRSIVKLPGWLVGWLACWLAGWRSRLDAPASCAPPSFATQPLPPADCGKRPEAGQRFPQCGHCKAACEWRGWLAHSTSCEHWQTSRDMHVATLCCSPYPAPSRRLLPRMPGRRLVRCAGSTFAWVGTV